MTGGLLLSGGVEPVLVRARSRADGGVVHDLVLRFETSRLDNTLSALCHVLHIETHVVVTNR